MIVNHESNIVDGAYSKSVSKRKIAEDHFKYWFDRADNFLERFNLMFAQRKFTDAAFDLHQIAESCYKAILLVFTNRMPREHFLEILDKEAQKHHVEIKNIFLRLSKDDERHFKLLEYAYIGGRYDPSYRISEKELTILLIKINKLLETSKKICKKRIKDIS